MAVTYSLAYGFAPNAFAFDENPDVSGRRSRYVEIGNERYEFVDDGSAEGVPVGADLSETLQALADSINESSHLVTAEVSGDSINLRAAFAGSWINGIRLSASPAITEAADILSLIHI